MPIDFMTALRSRARSQERSARLSGRPQTSVEAVAPYVAMAETAGDRFSRGKSIELQENAQDIQQGQFGETLELERQKQAENSRLEEQRLAEQKRAEEERMKAEAARLAETKRQTDLQVEAAEDAHKADTIQQSVSGGAIMGVLNYFWKVKMCIIISACTDPQSYEVNLSREFRDRFLGPITLRGYYAAASFVVPLIKRSRIFRGIIKSLLVDQLVDYGEWILEKKPETELLFSTIVSKGFLGLCRYVGECSLWFEHFMRKIKASSLSQ